MAKNNQQTENIFKDFCFNPYLRFKNNELLIIGIIIIFISGILNFFSNTHFDGIIDIHTGKDAPILVFIVEGLINLCLLVILFFLTGRIFARGNFYSILSQQAFARWPLLIASLITLTKPYQKVILDFSNRIAQNPANIFNTSTGQNLIFILFLFVFILIYIWVFYLMYQSYKRTHQLSGAKGISVFVIVCLIVEIISKTIIWNLIQ